MNTTCRILPRENDFWSVSSINLNQDHVLSIALMKYDQIERATRKFVARVSVLPSIDFISNIPLNAIDQLKLPPLIMYAAHIVDDLSRGSSFRYIYTTHKK